MIDYGYGVHIGDIPTESRSWRNSSLIRDWCRENDHIQPWRHQKWLDGLSSGKDLMYGIWKDGRPVGVCGLTNINYIHRTAEWSLYIEPSSWGKKLAIPALKTLLKHGFDALNLEVIWGEIFAHNKGSLYLAEKIGFKIEGLHKARYFKGGKRIDSIPVSIQRKEFKR